MRSARAGLTLFVAATLALASSAAGHGLHASPLGGAVEIDLQRVYQGCNDLVVRATPGTSWTTVVDHFSDPVSVNAVWRFDNQLHRYVGVYFSDPQAPTDGPPLTDSSAFAIFACVGHDGIVT
jgi:hypothetical protein